MYIEKLFYIFTYWNHVGNFVIKKKAVSIINVLLCHFINIDNFMLSLLCKQMTKLFNSITQECKHIMQFNG